MKAQRKQLYDDEDLFDDHPYVRETEESQPARVGIPRRSVTLSDFMAPGLLSRTDSDQDNEEFEEEEWFGEEEGDFNEEEDDYAELEKCFEELGKRFEWDEQAKDDIIDTLRNLNYNVKEFIRFDKDPNEGCHYLRPKKARVAPKPAKSVIIASEPAKPSKPATLQRSQSITVVRQHDSCNRKLVNVTDFLATQKRHVNLVVVGHVDAGKSTLMGHMMVLTGKVSHGQMTKLSQASKEINKEEDYLAWVMAEDDAEREHGITIDVALTSFETPKLNVTILDAPGHKDFVPNMIAGTSQADAALLVIDSSNPLIDRGQAREHLLLCRSLGVNNLVVAINKMDAVYYDESAYEDVKKRMSAFLKSLGWSAMTFIPTVASAGDNLIKRSTKMPWYKGPVIIEAIDNLPPSQCSVSDNFCLCVSESVEGAAKECIVSGKIEGGYVCKGDWLKIVPGMEKYAKVNGIKINGKQVQFAVAGQIADIALGGVSSEIPVGSAIIDPETSVPVATQFKARIVTFGMDVPLLKGAALMFHRHCVDVPLMIKAITGLVNKKTKEVEKKNPGYVPQNSMADVIFRISQPLPMQEHSKSKSFGRFIIRAKGETLGFGSITEIISAPEEPKKM